MKRMLWSVGLSLTTALAAEAQSNGPAAALGLPRAPATIGLPRAVSEPPPAPLPGLILPARAEMAQPLTPPAPFRTGQGVPKPYNANQIIDPKPMPMPGGPAIDEGKKGSLPAPMVNPGAESIAPPLISSGAPIVGSPIVTPDGVIVDGPPDLEAPPFMVGNRLRLSAEYLMWWTSGMNVPALVTTGPTAGSGVPGTPGVGVLFGNENIGPRLHSGFRTGFEYFHSPCSRWGFDGHYFFLSQQGASRGFASDPGGNPLLARPYYSANLGAPSAELVAFPGLYTGGIMVGNSTKLWGADINARRHFWQGPNSYVDGFFGYRYLSLNESLTIMERSAQIPPGVPGATVLSGVAFDSFKTSNQFNGGQVGTAIGTTAGRWSFDLRSSIALGTTSSILTIDGAQNVNLVGGGTAVNQGGLLALNSNIGRHYHEQFAVVPELTFNIGYNVTQKCRVFVGYNVLYWSTVLRPGNQIDPGLDENRIPNFPAAAPIAGVRPTVPFVGRDFIAQGLNFGLMFNW